MSDWEVAEGVRCVVCPGCGFTFDAVHTDLEPEEGETSYSCPVCLESSDSADDRFHYLLRWLLLERKRYQTGKWDYAEQDLEHAKEGLDETAWMWTRGVENYAGRVRLAQGQTGGEWWTVPQALQALMKLIATLLSMPEHLLRGGLIDSLPEPGHASGEVRPWHG